MPATAGSYVVIGQVVDGLDVLRKIGGWPGARLMSGTQHGMA
jgi:cyclophilin family peptidyl-prolyl cis-trans isomerase